MILLNIQIYNLDPGLDPGLEWLQLTIVFVYGARDG